MKDYEQLGSQALLDKGFTIDFLMTEHRDLLKRLRLDSDMGEGNIPLREDSDDPQDLESVAAYVIYQAVQWPYPDQVYGIELSTYLQEAANKYVEQNSIGLWGNHGKSEIVDVALASHHKRSFNQIKPESLTDAVIKAGIARNAEQLSDLPERKLSPEIALYAIQVSPLVFPLIPESLKTQQIIDLAVGSNGLNIAHLKEEEKSANRCIDAVKSNPFSIVFVPKEHQKPSLLKKALAGDGMAAQHIDDDILTPDLQKIAIKQNPLVLIAKPSLANHQNLRWASKHHPDIKNEEWYREMVKNPANEVAGLEQ